MVWMNIDKPTKKCTLHSNANCTYVKGKTETIHKGIGELRRDGGWLHFPNVREAQEYLLSLKDTYTLIERCVSDKDNIDLNYSKSNDEVVYNEVPINSATDHYQKIMDFPTNKTDLNSLPSWLRTFYITIMILLSLGSLIALYAFITKG